MRHLSPLELRVLRAVQAHPRMWTYELARLVGEQPEIVRRVLAQLRRLGLTERERQGMLALESSWSCTPEGERELVDWARRSAFDLPAGVVAIHGRRVARARRTARHG